MFHVSIGEVLVVAFIWAAITLGPVAAALLVGLLRRRDETRRREGR